MKKSYAKDDTIFKTIYSLLLKQAISIFVVLYGDEIIFQKIYYYNNNISLFIKISARCVEIYLQIEVSITGHI